MNIISVKKFRLENPGVMLSSDFVGFCMLEILSNHLQDMPQDLIPSFIGTSLHIALPLRFIHHILREPWEMKSSPCSPPILPHLTNWISKSQKISCKHGQTLLRPGMRYIFQKIKLQFHKKIHAILEIPPPGQPGINLTKSTKR